MVQIALSQKKDFEVTANKAHKLLESLKKYQNFKADHIRQSVSAIKFKTTMKILLVVLNSPMQPF